MILERNCKNLHFFTFCFFVYYSCFQCALLYNLINYICVIFFTIFLVNTVRIITSKCVHYTINLFSLIYSWIFSMILIIPLRNMENVELITKLKIQLSLTNLRARYSYLQLIVFFFHSVFLVFCNKISYLIIC